MKLERGPALAVAGGFLFLLAVAWVSVFAQAPRTQFSKSPQANSATVRAPVTASQFSAPATDPLELPGPPLIPSLGSGQTAKSIAVSVKIELRSGLVLEGHLQHGTAFACGTTFGQVSIPVEKIRGIRMYESPSPRATVILDNNDSLTVSLHPEQIQLKTEWGLAVVNLPYLQSLNMAAEHEQWIESEGRWQLVPIEKPKDSAEAAEPPDSQALPSGPDTVSPTSGLKAQY